MFFSTIDCPWVSAIRNWFDGNQYAFHQCYQIFSVIYALTRFYLGHNALDDKSDPREQFDWNVCVFILYDALGRSSILPT